MLSTGSDPSPGAAVRETIAAVATPAGVGGVAVIRLSGPASLEIARALLGGRPHPLVPRRAHYGVLRDADGVIDDGLTLWMPGPHSYTGEDVVEFQIHGSPVLARRLLRACYDRGARPAEPGEFTERAYRNGRLDLAQAEAVADLIHAQTEHAARLARASLDGALAERIAPLRTPLRELRAWVEADLDFGETDLDGDEPDVDHPRQGTVEATIRERLDRLRADAERLIHALSRNRLHRDGVKVAIVGAPNVGKSSLLNAWIGEDRAIVTDVAGTTRDVIEASFVTGDWLVRVLDTAGLRDSADVVERIGIERSRQAMAAADVVLWVADCTRPTETAPAWWRPDAPRETPSTGGDGVAHDAERPWLVVWNKADVANPPHGVDPRVMDPGVLDPHGVDARFVDPRGVDSRDAASALRERSVGGPRVPHRWVARAVSAVTGAGIDDLGSALTALFADHAGVAAASDEAAFSVRERHLAALKRFAQALADAETAPFADLRAEHLRLAEQALDRLFGHSDVEDLLGAIFSGFCIGK